MVTWTNEGNCTGTSPKSSREKSVLLPQNCYLKCKDLQSTTIVREGQKGKNFFSSSFSKPEEVTFIVPAVTKTLLFLSNFPSILCHNLRWQRPRFLLHILLKSHKPAVTHLALSPLKSLISLRPRPTQNTWSGAPDTWQSSAGTRWEMQHRDPGLHCAWQWEGKFHLRMHWIPSPAFVHISKQCSGSTSLPFPLPLMMLSAVSLCSGNPHRRSTKSALSIWFKEPEVCCPANDRKSCHWWEWFLWWAQLHQQNPHWHRALGWLPHSVCATVPPSTSSPRPEFRRDFLYLSSFWCHYLSDINYLSARESVYSWLDLKGLFQL